MSVSETQNQNFSGGGVLQTSLRVEWQAGGETYAEMTRLLDADLNGAAFALSRPVELGQMLKLTLPPVFENLRVKPDELQSETWALVWAVVPEGRSGIVDRPRHLTRVLFFGMDVPRSFVEGSGGPCLYVAEEDGNFRLQRDDLGDEQSSSQSNRRRESRIHLPYEVTAEVLDENGEVTTTELAITENVSRGGAALRTTLMVKPHTLIRLTCPQFNLSVNSIVRACRVGPDNIGRMHLEFLDGQWPL